MIKKCAFLCLLLKIIVLYGQDAKTVDSIQAIIDNTKIDTIKAANYLELSEAYRFKNPKKTLKFAKEALKLYKLSNHHKGQAKAYFYHTSYYNSIGNIDSARYFMRKNIKQSLLAKDTLSAANQMSNMAYFELVDGQADKSIRMLDSLAPVFVHFKDSSSLARTYLVKSQAYNLKGYPNLTLSEIQNALKIYRNLRDDQNIAQCLLIIGDQYQSESDDAKAIVAFEEALERYQNLDNQIFVAQTLSYMGDSYLQLGQYEEAERSLNKALELSQTLQFNANIGRTYLNLGRLKLKQDRADEAINYFNQGLDIYKTLGSVYNENRALYNLGHAYFEQQNFESALNYFDESIAISKSAHDSERLRDALYQKALTLEQLGNHKNALTAFKESKALSDSIFNSENLQKTKELQVIYETEKRQKELLIKTNKITMLEKNVKISQLQKLLLGVGLLLSIIAIGFGFYGFRQKSKRNKLEKEQLSNELTYKKKELTSQAMHLAKKNELLADLKSKVKHLKSESQDKHGYQELISAINFDLQDDKNWENFNQYFEQAYKGFNQRIKKNYPDINQNDLRLIALLKMNLSNKEVASILNISPDGVKKARYRVRKKLNLSTEDSLEQTLSNL